MAREITLSGGDTSVLKAIGLSGASIRGNLMIERLGNDLDTGDIIDTIEGLMMFDYVLASTDRFRTLEDVEKADFKINPSCAKELRDAVTGRTREPEQRRRRRG
jgi:hypothetical protein